MATPPPPPQKGPPQSRNDMVETLQLAGLDLGAVATTLPDQVLRDLVAWVQLHMGNPRAKAADAQPPTPQAVAEFRDQFGRMKAAFAELRAKGDQRQRVLSADDLGRSILAKEQAATTAKFGDAPKPKTTLTPARRAAILGGDWLGKSILKGAKK